MHQIADVRREPGRGYGLAPGRRGVRFDNSLVALVTIQLVRHIDRQTSDSKRTS